MHRPFASWPSVLVVALCGWLGATTPAAAQPAEAPPTPEQLARLKGRAELQKRIDGLVAEGKVADAIKAWKEELEQDRKVFGESHRETAESYAVLARLYEAAADFPAARGARVKQRDVLARVHGERDWRVADVRTRIDFADALAKLTPAERKELDGAAELEDAVLQLVQQGKARDALPHARRQVEVIGRLLPKDHPFTATAVHNLVKVYLDLGQYRTATEEIQTAKGMIARSVGERHPLYASWLNIEGSVYLNAGIPSAAIPVLEQAIELTRTLVSDQHPDHNACMNNLAHAYRKLGNYARALDLLRRAHRLLEQYTPEEDEAFATSLNNIAVVCKELHLYEEALAKYTEAEGLIKKHRGEEHPHYASTLSNRAGLLSDMGKHAEALRLYRRVLDLREKYLGRDDPLYADALNNLGAAYHATNDLREALAWYRKGLERRGELVGKDHPNYAESLWNVAGLHRDLGEYDTAEPMFREALKLQERTLTRRHPTYASTLATFGLLHHDMGRPAEAARELHEALTIEREFLEGTLAYLGGQQRRDVLARARATLHDYLSVARAAGTDAGQVYEHVLAWKGAVTARLAEERLARDQPELGDDLEKLRLLAGELASLAVELPTPNEADGWRKRLQQKEAEKQELESKIAKASDEFAAQLRLREPRLKGLTAPLPPGTALVDFLYYTHVPAGGKGGPARGQRRLLAFVSLPGQPTALVDLEAADPIDNAVRDWRDAVVNHKPVDATATAELVKLWRKVRPHLGAQTRVVLIAPEGALAAFPFAALPGDRPGRYLIEDYAIGYLTSGRALPRTPGRPARDLLALGNLVYGSGGKYPSDPLPGTARDCDTAAETFRRSVGQDARLLSGKVDAAALKKELARAPAWAHLHLGTHAHFDDTPAPPTPGLDSVARLYERNPLLRAQLVLTGANDDPVKGLLTGEEIAALDLRGTETAVLSACSSGLGAPATGEGMLGLQRAFEMAGVRATVATLWEADDQATADLMGRFYDNYWRRRMPRLEALREAQLWTLRERPGDNSDPYFWALWVLSGDAGELTQSQPYPDPAASGGPWWSSPPVLLGVAVLLGCGAVAAYAVRRRAALSRSPGTTF